MKKITIFEFVVFGVLLFLALPVVSANIEITDMGHYYDPIDGLTGYVDCQNVAEYDLLGALLVFIDGDIVAGEIIKARVRYVAGFRCAPTKTIEFPLNETEGAHHIVAYLVSMNNSIQRTYGYYAEDWWDDQGNEIQKVSEEEVEEDWLTCWGCEE